MFSVIIRSLIKYSRKCFTKCILVRNCDWECSVPFICFQWQRERERNYQFISEMCSNITTAQRHVQVNVLAWWQLHVNAKINAKNASSWTIFEKREEKAMRFEMKTPSLFSKQYLAWGETHTFIILFTVNPMGRVNSLNAVHILLAFGSASHKIITNPMCTCFNIKHWMFVHHIHTPTSPTATKHN